MLVEMQVGTATMENCTEVSQKIENRTTVQSSNSTPGYISKENENTNLKKKHKKTMFIAALFTVDQIGK